MNRHKIFSSLFSLNFKNSEIDKLFRKYKNEEKKLKILIVFLVCTQIINTILSYILKPMNFSISFENRLYLNTIFPQIKIYTYFCIFITISLNWLLTSQLYGYDKLCTCIIICTSCLMYIC